jgi:hypothetical protein
MCLTAIVGSRLWKLVFRQLDVLVGCPAGMSTAAGRGVTVARGPMFAVFKRNGVDDHPLSSGRCLDWMVIGDENDQVS